MRFLFIFWSGSPLGLTLMRVRSFPPEYARVLLVLSDSWLAYCPCVQSSCTCFASGVSIVHLCAHFSLLRGMSLWYFSWMQTKTKSSESFLLWSLGNNKFLVVWCWCLWPTQGIGFFHGVLEERLCQGDANSSYVYLVLIGHVLLPVFSCWTLASWDSDSLLLEVVTPFLCCFILLFSLGSALAIVIRPPNNACWTMCKTSEGNRFSLIKVHLIHWQVYFHCVTGRNDSSVCALGTYSQHQIRSSNSLMWSSWSSFLVLSSPCGNFMVYFLN